MIFSKSRPKPVPSLVEEVSPTVEPSAGRFLSPLKAVASQIITGASSGHSETAASPVFKSASSQSPAQSNERAHTRNHQFTSRFSESNHQLSETPTTGTPRPAPTHALNRDVPVAEQAGVAPFKPPAHELTDLEKLPAGEYIHFESLEPPMPESYREIIALLKTGTTSVSLLCPTTSRQNHIVFDAHERLRDQGISVSIVHASTHVLQALHDANRQNLRKAKDVTKDERVAWDMIESAAELGASDIHLESRGTQTSVLFRINGERYLQPAISTRTADAVCSALYNVHADANNKETHWDSNKVQDTVVDRVINGTPCQIRFHSAPIHPAGNFQVVMRLLISGGQVAKPVEDIGYTDAQVGYINQMMSGSNGLLLTVGSVNSGKSTSMHSFLTRLRALRGETAKIVTVEDPVEYVIAGACQMGIPKGRTNLTDKATDSIYTSFLQATLREDTDIVMLGEIRSRDSASTVKDLVLTGRKTLSTLHVYEAFATFARLRELDIPESLLFTPGFISGIIYQKLLPTLCKHCALTMDEAEREGVLAPDLRRRIGAFDAEYGTDYVRFRKQGGCPKCSHTGIGVRSICAEIIPPDEAFLALLRAGDVVGAKTYWHSMPSLNVDGLGVTALAHGISKMLMGMFDPRDVENQLGMLSSLIRPPRSLVQVEDGAIARNVSTEEPIQQIA